MKKVIYIVTGAAGHLGSTVVRKLLALGKTIRTLVLPHEMHKNDLIGMEIYEGDVCNEESLEPLFATQDGEELIVIHCAGIVSIASGYHKIVYDVNVSGTRNVVDCCIKHHVKKLVYVSSVHAIPEKPKGEIITEISHFDPGQVVGLYAKTKSEATQIVLNAAAEGLDASVVHPSGICGPYDYGRGHITQLFKDYYKGSLTAAVKGGYDFCDVRDVADGIISCVENGKQGECYILSGKYYSIPDMLEYFHEITGKKPIKTYLPLWFAKLTAPLAEVYYKILRQPPLYTSYSLYTLETNANFSNEKAKSWLGYHVRPITDTIKDMMNWMKKEKLIPA